MEDSSRPLQRLLTYFMGTVHLTKISKKGKTNFIENFKCGKNSKARLVKFRVLLIVPKRKLFNHEFVSRKRLALQ